MTIWSNTCMTQGEGQDTKVTGVPLGFRDLTGGVSVAGEHGQRGRKLDSVSRLARASTGASYLYSLKDLTGGVIWRSFLDSMVVDIKMFLERLRM